MGDESSDMKIVANRIVWGKFSNAGQTCIAPDYILCKRSVVDSLIEELKTSVIKFYGESPKQSKDYGKIVNLRRFKRLMSVLDGMAPEKIVYGGGHDESTEIIEPTIIKDVTLEDTVMKDELFGPILPILDVDSPQMAIEIINSREK